MNKIIKLQWVLVPGKLKSISCGSDVVVGVDSDNNILYREGMSTDQPTGSSWRRKQGTLTQVEVYRDKFFGITEGGVIIQQPLD